MSSYGADVSNTHMNGSVLYAVGSAVAHTDPNQFRASAGEALSYAFTKYLRGKLDSVAYLGCPREQPQRNMNA